MKAEIVGQAPVVYIEEEAWKDIKTIVKLCDKEVAWVGLVDVVKDDKKPLGDFLVYKVFLPKQKVSGAECEYEAEDMARIAHECGDDLEDVSKMRLWGHSHANMGVFASGQDQKELLARPSWLIQQITNKKGDIMHRLWLPEQSLLVSDLEMVVLEEGGEREVQWKAEIKERVQEKSYGGYKGGHDGMTFVGNGVWVRDDGRGKKGKKKQDNGGWYEGWVWSKKQQKFQPKEVVEREEREEEKKVQFALPAANGNSGSSASLKLEREDVMTVDEKFEAWYQRHYGDVGGEG